MKKFLFFFLAALIVCGQWATVSARYNLGQRKAYNEIKAGDTIAIQGISDNAGNGYRFIAGAQLQTPFTEDCVFTVEEGPADIRTGEPTYFLRNIVADKYFGKNGLRGTGPSGWNDTRLVSTPDSAYNFMLACAADSTQEWKEQHNFDELSTVFIYSYVSGSEDKYVNMCNWGYYEPEKIYMWGYTDTNPWDVYSVMYEKDLCGELADLVDYYSSLNLEFPAGSDPGFYPTETAQAFTTAMDEAIAEITYAIENERYGFVTILIDKSVAELVLVLTIRGIPPDSSQTFVEILDTAVAFEHRLALFVDDDGFAGFIVIQMGKPFVEESRGAAFSHHSVESSGDDHTASLVQEALLLPVLVTRRNKAQQPLVESIVIT